VTVPPYHQPAPSGVPAGGWPPGYLPVAASGPAAPPRRSRRRLVVAAVVAGVLVLGGAGYAVAEYLSGGGTQPEEVLPADTLAFVRLDLDPAAGQKMALMGLLEEFPDLDAEGDGALEQRLLDPLLDLGGITLDYAADVEPWLGDRLAVAAVPAEGTEAGVAPVLALAVDDMTRMADTLDRVQESTAFGFAVRDGYVLITDTQERADGLVAAEDTLADDADFTGDRAALDGDQIALAWADLSAAQDALAAAAPGSVTVTAPLTGRLILGLHVEADAVEVVGLDFSASDVRVPAGEPTRLVQDLPEDTLAALAVAGVGDQVVAAWEEFEAAGAPAEFEEALDQLGLDLPEDLRALLGTDLVVAAFGDPADPLLGARVRSEDPDAALSVLDGLVDSPDRGLPLVSAPAPDGFVVGTDRTGLDRVLTDGGLGDTDAFRAAVPEADSATAVGYVDLGSLVDQLIAQGGETGQEAARFAAVEALGFSASGTDEGGRFVLRITTR
jgi:hypothetical protein